MKRYIIRKTFRFDEGTEDMLKETLQKINSSRKKKLSESEYLRQLIASSFAGEKGISRDDIIAMKKTFAGIGNNINQIAHRMNMAIYTPEDTIKLSRCIDEVVLARHAIERLLDKMEGK